MRTLSELTPQVKEGRQSLARIHPGSVDLGIEDPRKLDDHPGHQPLSWRGRGTGQEGSLDSEGGGPQLVQVRKRRARPERVDHHSHLQRPEADQYLSGLRG